VDHADGDLGLVGDVAARDGEFKITEKDIYVCIKLKGRQTIFFFLLQQKYTLVKSVKKKLTDTAVASETRIEALAV
jgi:hypothetical protein